MLSIDLKFYAQVVFDVRNKVHVVPTSGNKKKHFFIFIKIANLCSLDFVLNPRLANSTLRFNKYKFSARALLA